MSGPSFLQPGVIRLEEMGQSLIGTHGLPAEYPLTLQLHFASLQSESLNYQSVDNSPTMLLDNDHVPLYPTPRAAIVSVRTTAQVARRVYSKAEWEIKRDTIRTLYWDEGKILTEVMSIMAEHYKFHATQAAHQTPYLLQLLTTCRRKMYKSRLQKWGLWKNTRIEDAAQILYDNKRREAVGKSSKFTKDGKEIDIRRILAYVRRRKLAERDLTTHVGPSTASSRIICRSPSPILSKPSQLEGSIDEIVYNVIGQLRAWNESHNSTSNSISCWEGYREVTPSAWQLKDWIFYGQRCFEEAQFHRGGILLRNAFQDIEKSICRLDPITPIRLLHLFHCLRLEDVARMLVDHLCSLSLRILQPQHPLVQLLHSLKRLIKSTTVQQWCPTLEEFLSNTLPGIDESFGNRRNLIYDLPSKETKNAHLLSQMMANVQNETPCNHNKCYDAAAYLFYSLLDTYGWQYSGTLEAAQLMVNHAEASLEHSKETETEVDNKGKLSFGLEKLAYCHKSNCKGEFSYMDMRYTFACQVLRQAVEQGIAADGLHSPNVIRMLERLKNWYSDAGNVASAAGVEHQLQKAYALERERTSTAAGKLRVSMVNLERLATPSFCLRAPQTGS
jgi:hypothetical protein